LQPSEIRLGLADAIVLFIVVGMLIITPLWISSTTALGGAEASIDGVPARAGLGVPFEIAANETVQVEGSDIAVKFINVTEDSRCPSDVTCIWAGQVTVEVGLTQGTTDLGRFALTLGADSSMAEHKVGAYLIKLTEVEPDPISTQTIEQSEYVATLIVSDDQGSPLTMRSVLVMAIGTDDTQNPAMTAFISSWSFERENGTAIFVIRDNDNNGDMPFARAVARFLPLEAECMREGMSECVDGQITSISGNAGISEGDSIHFEVDANRTQLFVSFKSPTDDVSQSGEGPEYPLDIRKFREVQKPYIPQDGNATIVVLREGQREGPLLVQRIYPDRIEGLNYPEYPIAMEQGLPIILRIGEKASNGCTVFLTLAKIEDGSATFLKKVDESRPCPICWAQLQMMSGWS